MSLEVNIEKNLGTFNLKVNFNSNDKTLGFLGESGSGKSMSLKCIAGLETPDKGRIVINDKVLFDSEKKINVPTKDRKIGYLFQNYALFPNMTIEDNITIGLQNLKKSEKKRLCNEYIEKFHLHGLNKRYPWQLSGGQQQRVALARALITNPEILLLDEPFSALDHHLRHSMERELINSLKDYKGNVIFVTHDIEESYRVCENIIVYDKGSALSKKSRDQLFISPSSLAEAKLTGCNNISRVKRINENTIYAIDFGYEYSFDYTLNENIEYMGIRSHHIKISSSLKENTNCHLFKIVNIIENPFDFSISVVSDKDDSLNVINVKIEKNNFNYKINDKIYLTFYSNNIFLF